jgi:hypothetical protein
MRERSQAVTFDERRGMSVADLYYVMRRFQISVNGLISCRWRAIQKIAMQPAEGVSTLMSSNSGLMPIPMEYQTDPIGLLMT